MGKKNKLGGKKKVSQVKEEPDVVMATEENTKLKLEDEQLKVGIDVKVEKSNIKDENPNIKDEKFDIKIKKSKIKDEKDWRYYRKSGLKVKRPPRGVVYIGSLPHGFYEEQLKEYFGQFGKVTGVYLPKSKTTGRPRGYGFVEFLHPEVADVAAETMNNYLMFNRLLKTKVIPPTEQKPHMFKDMYTKMRHSRDKVIIKRRIVAKKRSLRGDERKLSVAKAMKDATRLENKLKSLGVEYKIKVA